MFVRKMDFVFDFDRLWHDIFNFTNQYPFHPNERQLCLTMNKKFPVNSPIDPWFGTGAPYPYKDISKKEKDYNIKLWNEADFSGLHANLVGTEIERIYTELGKLYTFGRVRLMKLERKTCMTFHRDHEPRIHIPIITNSDCYMLFRKDGVLSNYQMDAGNMYWANTTEEHTFLNSGTDDRIHLLFNVICDA